MRGVGAGERGAGKGLGGLGITRGITPQLTPMKPHMFYHRRCCSRGRNRRRRRRVPHSLRHRHAALPRTGQHYALGGCATAKPPREADHSVLAELSGLWSPYVTMRATFRGLKTSLYYFFLISSKILFDLDIFVLDELFQLISGLLVNSRPVSSSVGFLSGVFLWFLL